MAGCFPNASCQQMISTCGSTRDSACEDLQTSHTSHLGRKTSCCPNHNRTAVLKHTTSKPPSVALSPVPEPPQQRLIANPSPQGLRHGLHKPLQSPQQIQLVHREGDGRPPGGSVKAQEVVQVLRQGCAVVVPPDVAPGVLIEVWDGEGGGHSGGLDGLNHSAKGKEI
jgi:hypothetical protein